MTTPAHDPLVGTKIREYEILEVLGQGRMGAVYRARHIYLEEERAIKVIQTGAIANKILVNRFIREARILAKLRHPNLVELHDFGTLTEGTFFMVLELMRGETVEQRLHRDRRIPVVDAVRIIHQAAVGLQEAHAREIIHRDIHPAKLWVIQDRAGQEVTKVSGFSIAKPTAEETRTLTPTLFFQPEYLSPEQYGSLKKGETVDHRTDIYSLCVTLYRMLSGEFPFETPVPRGTPVPLSSRVPQLMPGLERIILKGLALNRDDRQSSMQELAHELDEVRMNGSATIHIQAEQRPKPKLSPGTLFAGRYLLEQRLGKGGMGTVYKAIDRILDVPVALKTMNAELVDDEKTLARFKREVILARKVAHPNVCRIYDIGESDGIHYVSMEYLQGITLSDMLLTRGAFSMEEGLPIIHQLLLALQEAHRAGVIHRDLKPQNIIVDADRRTCIMDFGISVSEEVSRMTATGLMIGTPRYMAPEQFSDSHLDQRSDLYSMGVILYEMFTGRLPYEANTPASVMYACLNLPPLKPSDVLPGFPTALERIILKALEKNPQNRYRTAGELIAALEKMGVPSVAAATQIFTPASPAPPVQTVKAESTHLLKIAGLFLFIVCAAGVGIWFWKSREVKPDAPAAVSPAEHHPVRENPPQHAVVLPAPSPSQTPTQTATKTIETVAEPIQTAVSEPKSDSLQVVSEAAVEPPAADDTVKADTPEVVPPPKPVAAEPGRIAYSGEYPVSIYNGKVLVMSSAKSPSVELPSGTYNLTLISKTNAIIRQTQKIIVKSGQTTTIASPAMAKLTLTANPRNCKIYVDMIFVDQAPLFDFPIQAGNHHVKVEWEKMKKDKGVFITVTPGQTMTLKAISDETTTDVYQDVTQ